MKAPDKIYVPVVTSMLTKQQDLHHEWQYSPLSFSDENIEYFNKNFLVEWANAHKVACIGDNYTDGRNDAMDLLIKMLDSINP